MLAGVIVILVAACSQTGGKTPSVSPSTSRTAQATAVSDWKTITDAKYGYVFNYPASWKDVTVMRQDPPGSHEVANRETSANPMNLGPTDWHLYVAGYPSNSSGSCGAVAAYGTESSTELDGEPAQLFVRKGWEADPNQWIVDLVAQRTGTCVHLQQVTGNTVSEQDATGRFATIQASFRFGE